MIQKNIHKQTIALFIQISLFIQQRIKNYFKFKKFKSVRLITNLLTISNIIERLILHHLKPPLVSMPNYFKFQSTLIMGTFDGNGTSSCHQRHLASYWCWLNCRPCQPNISAAFYKVYYRILLDQREEKFGVRGLSHHLIGS